MFKRYLAIFGTGFSLFGVVFHYLSYGYVALSTAVAQSFTATTYALKADLAHSWGYVPPPEEEIQSVEILCTMEAVRWNLTPEFFCGLMSVESAGRADARSPKGAIGLMQVMPENWDECAAECGLTGPEDLKDKKKNLCCGGWWINYELSQHNDSISAVQSYNGGPGCVGRCKESIKHAQKVLTAAIRPRRSES